MRLSPPEFLNGILVNAKASLGFFAIFSFLVLLPNTKTKAEGSKDFINYPGYRLFFDTKDPQQLKVYANVGEYINVGASHIGIQGGFIQVYRPDGTLDATFDDDSTGEAVIYNSTDEANGPTGGGTTNGSGYEPGVIQVGFGEEGVWTIIMDFPTYTTGNFTNILNNESWTRSANQPNIPRVILAWDVTVSSGAAGNDGGSLLNGRVYSNEYISVINLNGFTTSPTFYILTKDGFIYQTDFKDTDPYRFPITSSSTGFLYSDLQPAYSSQERNNVTRSNEPLSWTPGGMYYYEPQAQDFGDGLIINNKVFFNPPDPTMPGEAAVTDFYGDNTHTTWLYSEPEELTVEMDEFSLVAFNDSSKVCLENVVELGVGGFIKFNASLSGTAELLLDLDNNNVFTDEVDRVLYKSISAGQDSIFWDGLNGLGNPVPVAFDFTFNYSLKVRGGETHIIMADVENNMGGVTFQLYNDVDVDDTDLFYYDHTPVGAGVSGGGTPGNALPTNQPFTYESNFGNNKFLDYWTYVNYNGGALGTFIINIADDCTALESPDSDGDGIPDIDDIDDDNDGVPDLKEYCNPGNGFDCLTGQMDPSHDEDGDGIPNYLDADDSTVPHGCLDEDNNGICDTVAPEYDTDGDRVPDHLDLDSDNDGITDLIEAGHFQVDANGDGMIDGEPALFGLNGLFNPIASDPDALNAVETYTRWDWDVDGVPDHDDLDADNDGLNDVLEAGHGLSDTNNDGRIDDGNGNPPIVSKYGIAPLIDPDITNVPIPLPIDKDMDEVPDWHDLDSDNDTILDVEEGGSPDPDDDGVIGIGTPVVDVNGQSTADENGTPIETTSRPKDTDSDIVPDFHDLDTDNDGINDVTEASREDPDNDGLPGIGMPVVNQVGIPAFDMVGNPIDPATSLPDDTDGDGVRDYRDLDADNDGINDVIEGGNPDEDGDGFIGAGPPMVDQDGLAFASGVGMPVGTTSFPTDTDGDDIPDFRELDSDGDMISDVIEGGNPDPDFDDIIGTGTPDVNDFGQAFNDEVFTPLTPTSDPTDTDGDGIPDFQELDSDDDNILDQDECPDDTPCIDGDGDGAPDFQDPDRDNDGIADDYECETSTPCPDTDGDGILDVDDLDTDGDGLLDALECPDGAPCPDSNNNGIPDWREYQCTPMIAVPEVADISGDGVYCMGDDILLSATNNVVVEGDVSYRWTGPNGFQFSGTAPMEGPFTAEVGNLEEANSGTYVLELFTEFGCPGEPQAISITVNPMPETPALMINEPELCEGELLELSSTVFSGGNAFYTWYFDNGSGPQLIATTDVPNLFIENVTAANEGFYSVLTEVGGCPSLLSNTQLLNINNGLEQTPALTLEESTLCEGETITLNSEISVESGASYNWYFDGGTGPVLIATTGVPSLFIENATAANNGIYNVQIQIGGCQSALSNAQMLTVNDQLEETPALALEDDKLCEGETIELNSTIMNGTDVQYNWYFDDGTGSVLIATTNIPTLFIENAMEANSGIYNVQTQIGTCQSALSNSEMLTIDNLTDETPELAVIDDMLCEGEFLELNATTLLGSENSYEWFFDDGTGAVSIGITDVPTFFLEDVTPANSGNYTVVVHQDNCFSHPSNEQDVQVVEEPVIEAINNTDIENPACIGDAVELSVPMIFGATYEWMGPMGFYSTLPNPVIENVTPEYVGLYQAVIHTESCEFMATPTEVFIYDEIVANDDQYELGFNEMLTSTDLVVNDDLGDVEEWIISVVTEPQFGTVTEENGMISYKPRQNYFGPDVFTYEVCNRYCPDVCDEATVNLFISGTNASLACFVPNIITPNQDGANDFFKVPCLEDTFMENRVQIFNRWGDVVYQAEPYLNNWDGDFKGDPLPAGTYFYLIWPETNKSDCLSGYFTLTR